MGSGVVCYDIILSDFNIDLRLQYCKTTILQNFYLCEISRYIFTQINQFINQITLCLIIRFLKTK